MLAVMFGGPPNAICARRNRPGCRLASPSVFGGTGSQVSACAPLPARVHPLSEREEAVQRTGFDSSAAFLAAAAASVGRLSVVSTFARACQTATVSGASFVAESVSPSARASA